MAWLSQKTATILLLKPVKTVNITLKIAKTSPNRPRQRADGRQQGDRMKNNEIRQQILKELLENEPLTSSIEKLNQQLDHAGKEELGRLMGLVYTYGYESCVNDTLHEMQNIYGIR